MPDRRNGPGDERYPTSRYARPPDEEWVPETEHREEHGTEGLRPGTEGLGATGRDRPATARGESRGGTPAPAPDVGRMPDDGLGAPSPGDVTAREAGTTEGTAPDAWPTAPGTRSAPSGAGAPLVPHEETERWEERMRQVAAGFVDRPRAAVEEADRALDEIATRFGEAVNRRRRTLRMSWEDTGDRGPANETDTEQLRLALRDYRDLADRLLRL
ncbi:hypothetical protein [Streptomyces sp. NPDC048106]|uniref:hypothetical protein n=1 Tax=Streptomyces sp. NPDC048106 TaxID=3155750 RepID=UPI0034548AB7